jgi:geranylgeranyl diphosphate synthase type I
MNIKDFKKEFDTAFMLELKNLSEQAGNRIHTHSTKQYIDYILSIASNGKRIRPYNVALTYSIYSGNDWHTIENTLIGIELIHLMAIIHDDEMDNSDTRHGVMSVHTYNQTKDSWNIIHSLMEEVIVGQMMDVYNPIETKVSLEDIEKKMLLKTARYTFTHPLLLGATLAGTEKENILWINKFGDSVGLLFQIQDDIFDITKDVETLKKDPLGDMKNGIHTMLSVYITENATKSEQDLWATWFGNKNTNNQEEIKSFIVSAGALKFVEDIINQKEKDALLALSESNLNTEDTIKIKELLSVITKRKY